MISLVAKGEGLATESPGTIGEIADAVGKNDGSVLGDSIAKGKLPPLFDAGYCDVMPVDEAQLATQRAYIRSNPRSRLMRTTYRSWLQPQRHTVDTLLLTPWGYQFRTHDESVSAPFCKTMNCVVQAICRIKDDWWKETGR